MNIPDLKKIIPEDYKNFSLIEKKILKNGVSIHGVGFLGNWVLNDLKKNNIVIKDLYDKNKFDNKYIKNPDKNFNPNCPVIICSRHFINEVKDHYHKKKILSISADTYYLIKNYKNYKTLFKIFSKDEKSVLTLANLINILATGKLEKINHLEKNMYFSPSEFYPDFNSTFVDAGAFTGDTLEEFIRENMGSFKKIYAFEPGAKQIKALKTRLKRLISEWSFNKKSVIIEKAALSKKNGFTYFNGNNNHEMLSFAKEIKNKQINHSENKIKTISLDTYLGEKEVSFIKADVEGMEIELIEGAAKIINKQKPLLAIAAYHYPNDIYNIFNLIKSIRNDYRFSLRHHAKVIGDYVLYAY